MSGGSLQGYLVDNDGNINFPIVGSLHVQGLTKNECQDLIKSKIKPYLNVNENPIVTVRMSSYRVTVIGEVGRPSVIPVTTEKMSIIEALAQAGDLGIYGKQVTDEVIENIDKDMPYGIYISYTEEKSPAYVAGVMNGDILTEINGKKVQDFETFTSVLQKCQVNEDVVIKVMRKGKDGYKEIKYTVQIGGR